MTSSAANAPLERPLVMAALGFALAVALAAPTAAQPPRRAATVRRGAPGAPPQPLTDVSVSLGSARYEAKVDADCHVDERAVPVSTRAYFVARYPWFGQRPPADQPQWRFGLEIRRGAAAGAAAGAYDQFVFSFLDGTRSGTIQTVAGSERMGSGTVRVTRHGAGARFDVEGRTKEGDAVRATIDCSAFQKSEGSGG